MPTPSTTFTVTRDVDPTECPWLHATVPAGTVVYRYFGCLYDCIDSGIAVTVEPGETPFFELPLDALQ